MTHVYSKDAYMHTVILLDFIDVFCMYVDFYLLSFRHCNAGPMTLPTDVKQQCHHYVDQYTKVSTKVIPHTITCQIIHLFLIF